MKDKMDKKIEFEKKILREMILLYCNKKHKSNTLCSECRELLEYSNNRVDNCKYIDEKSFCSNCKIKCYSPKTKEKIREVMRFSGKRMLFSHPILCVKHIIYSFKNR